MPKTNYQLVYESALKAKTLEKLREMLQDIDINSMHEGLTVAEDFIDAIPDFSLTRSTPASRKLRDDLMTRVAWLHELGADVNKLAKRYAMKGLYQQVDLYRVKYHADEEQIAIGYVYGMTNYGEKIRAYETRYGAARFGIPMTLMLKGYAKADYHSHQSSNKVKEYLNEPGLSQEARGERVRAVVECYDAECDKLSCSEVFDKYPDDYLLGRLTSAVQRGAPKKEIDGYIDNSEERKKKLVALVYIRMGKDDQAEIYVTGITTQFNGLPQEIKEIVGAYAEGGHHAKVDSFLSKASKDDKIIVIASAIEGYIKAGDHAKVEDYRSKHNVDIRAIAELYKKYVNINGKDFVPPLYKAINLLKEQGKVGDSVIASMVRLKAGQDNHYNPYWMNSGKKLNLIIDAVLKVSERGESIADHIKNKESVLYKALNMQRITLDLMFKEAKTATAVVKAQKDEEPKPKDGNTL